MAFVRRDLAAVDIVLQLIDRQEALAQVERFHEEIAFIEMTQSGGDVSGAESEHAGLAMDPSEDRLRVQRVDDRLIGGQGREAFGRGRQVEARRTAAQERPGDVTIAAQPEVAARKQQPAGRIGSGHRRASLRTSLPSADRQLQDGDMGGGEGGRDLRGVQCFQPLPASIDEDVRGELSLAVMASVGREEDRHEHPEVLVDQRRLEITFAAEFVGQHHARVDGVSRAALGHAEVGVDRPGEIRFA